MNYNAWKTKTMFIKLLVRDLLQEKNLLLGLSLLGFFFFFIFNLFGSSGEQQFFVLAQSFLHGHVYLGPSSSTLDGSYFHGFAYWPQGVFPAVLLTPFVALFSNLIQQGQLQFILNFLNFYLLYSIAYKITNNKTTSLWLSFGYLFSTVYLAVGLVAWSWWFAQVVATSCLLLLVSEFMHKRRWFVMGICVALATATRIDLFFAVFFPLFSLVFSRQSMPKKAANGLIFLSPVLFGFAGIAWYNFMRFGSVWEFGYAYHIPAIASAGKLLQQYGAWNLFYFPTNFYYLFLKGVDAVSVTGTNYLAYPFIKPNPWGMSIFLTSPVLLWCLRAKWKDQIVKASAATALFMLIFLLGYFGIGARQYGYRYALDFQPFLFLILCFAFRSGMSRSAKMVIVVSFFFNLLFFSGIFTSVVR